MNSTMDFEYVLLLYSSSVIERLITIVCMLGLYYFMFRDLRSHQLDILGLPSLSGNTSIAGAEFSSCNLRHQSTPVSLSRPRLASATSSLNSLVDVEPFRLPDFWHSNVHGYFQTAEILLDYENVSDEVSKYTKLLDSLQKNHAVFLKITDISQYIPNDPPYFSLKAFLFEKFYSTTRDNVSALLHTCRRGDDSVLDYYQRLKTTLSDAFEPESNFQTELFCHCMLNSVDVDVRMNLYHYQHLPIDEFVKHADRLSQCKQRPHIFGSAHTLSSTPVTPPSHNQHIINELLESRLKDIQECVNSLADTTTQHRLNNMPLLDSNSFATGDTSSP